MSCGCKETGAMWRVPMRDTGIWNTSNTGRKQQTTEAYAKRAMQPHPVRGGATRGKTASVHYTLLDGLDGPRPVEEPCGFFGKLFCRCGKCAERRRARRLPRIGDPDFYGPLPYPDPTLPSNPDPARREDERQERQATSVFVLAGLGVALWALTRA